MSGRPLDERRLIGGIMLAVLVWGSVLSLGTFLFGIDQQAGGIKYAPNPLRGLIMFSFVLGFVGFWKWMLSHRDKSG